MMLPRVLLPALSLLVTLAIGDDFPCPNVLPIHPNTVSSNTVSSSTCEKGDDEKLQVSRKRIFKRQAGRAGRLEGCGNPLLAQIMQNVLGQILSQTQMKLADSAQVLQKAVQAATGNAHEVFMGKGNMVFASHQMSESSQCRLRIGEYYTTVYQTPIGAGGGGYDVNNVAQEQQMSNVDFGAKNGGSGFPGQQPFPHISPLEALALDSNVALQSALAGSGIAAGGITNGLFGGPGGGGGGGGCFSGDLIVETSEGPKAMKHLKTGDQVLSIDETMVSYSPIVMFLHRDEKLLAEFNVITTASGNQVKLTNEHLIYVSDCYCTAPLRLVKAEDVTTEHYLLTVRSLDRSRTLDRVINVTKTYEVGVYAPLTLTGDVIVNDVLSSCHCSVGMKSLQDSVFSIYRFFNNILPETGDLPFGLEFLKNALELFVPSKAVFG